MRFLFICFYGDKSYSNFQLILVTYSYKLSNMKTILTLFVTFFSIIFISNELFAQSATAEDAVIKVLYNVVIFTAEPTQPYAEAIAIKGDKILAVGSKQEVLAAAGANALLTDLHGQFLLPGLIDSHAHAIGGGQSLITADFGEQNQSIKEMAVFAEQSRLNGRGMMGDVLNITGLSLVFWSHIKELNEIFNSGIYAKQPVVLQGMDYHTGWANKAMMKRAGLNKAYLQSLPPERLKLYGYNQNLEPNGFAVDAGFSLIAEKIPPFTPERNLQAGMAAVTHLNSLGITAWIDPNANEPELTIYKQLLDQGKLTAHIDAFPVVEPDNNIDSSLAKIQALKKQFEDTPNLLVTGIKVYADGVVEYPSQTATLSHPYRNTGKFGNLLFKPENFNRLAVAADKQGLIVHVHAIGDSAITATLNGVEAARKINGNSGLPHTITHLQFILPKDQERFKQLGVIASYQLYWAVADKTTIDIVQPYIDPSIYPYQYPARSLLNAGTIIAGASDWPVSTPNPFDAIYVAETRKGSSGILNKAERLPREAMLYAYTINGAFAMNRQHQIGSIAPGKQADLVLADRDLLTVSSEDIKQTKIVWTMFGGKIVYKAN